MAAEDNRYIWNALRYKFTKEYPLKAGLSTEYMPSVLAISADVIDAYNKRKNKDKNKCMTRIVNCSVHKDCEETPDCVYNKRIFYGYLDEHFAIMQKPEKLEGKLKMDNHYPMDKGDPLQELFSKTNYWHYKLPAEVLYRYYEVMPTNHCYWHIDYYEELLASIFLFCPEILCFAIKKELKQPDKADIHVVSAIKKCLEFSVRLDRKDEGELPKEKRWKRKFYGNILNEINNFHILCDVGIALTEGIDQNNSIGEIVKMAMDASRDVVRKVAGRLSEWLKQSDREKLKEAMKNLVGLDNYTYIYEKCLNTG